MALIGCGDIAHAHWRGIQGHATQIQVTATVDADFARAVSTGTDLVAGPEESLGELRTALAMYRSAESRQWEKVW
jgi:predicted dehydrogenase